MGQIGNRKGVAKMSAQCQGGGNKKAGLVPTATSQMLSQSFGWRAALGGQASRGAGRGNGGNKPFIISTVNQLGGVGKYRSATSISTADGAILSAIQASARNCNSGNYQNFNFNYPGQTNVGFNTKQVFVCPRPGMGAGIGCVTRSNLPQTETGGGGTTVPVGGANAAPGDD